MGAPNSQPTGNAVDPLDLTTVGNVIEYLPNSANANLNLLQRLVTAASTFILSNINRSFTQNMNNEVRNGTGGQMLVFSDYPVTAVTSLLINGQPIAPSYLGPSGPTRGFIFDKNTLYLIGYRFERGLQNITVAYTSGLTEIPHDVEQVCVDLVCRKYLERQRIGQTAKGIGPETIHFTSSDLTDEFKSLLRQHAKVAPV